MIRLGVLQLNLMPENLHSRELSDRQTNREREMPTDVTLITDGIAGIPEPAAVHDLLAQLRQRRVACSFVQVCTSPTDCLGYGTL